MRLFDVPFRFASLQKSHWEPMFHWCTRSGKEKHPQQALYQVTVQNRNRFMATWKWSQKWSRTYSRFCVPFQSSSQRRILHLWPGVSNQCNRRHTGALHWVLFYPALCIFMLLRYVLRTENYYLAYCGPIKRRYWKKSTTSTIFQNLGEKFITLWRRLSGWMSP